MNATSYERPLSSVDNVPLTIHRDALCVVLADRRVEPHVGERALIGGWVRVEEDGSCGAAARRVLADKAGMTDIYVEQLSTFSGPTRDPRGWSMTVAYYSLVPIASIQDVLLRPDLHVVPVEEATGLPFDHDEIVAAAVRRIRGKGAYSDLPARLLPPEFSLGELHRAYECVLGETIDYSAFRRKIADREFLEKIDGLMKTVEGADRPSQAYRLRGGIHDTGSVAIFDRRF